MYGDILDKMASDDALQQNQGGGVVELFGKGKAVAISSPNICIKGSENNIEQYC